MMVVSFKYVIAIMQADNKGEGGILALMALAQRGIKGGGWRAKALIGVGIFGAALFYGDGMITPAISVLSAFEGISIVSPQLWVLHHSADACGADRAVSDPEARHSGGRQAVWPDHAAVVRDAWHAGCGQHSQALKFLRR